jgi:hypothetical protein
VGVVAKAGKPENSFSILQEFIRVDSPLPQNGSKCALRHFAGVVGNGRIAIRLRIKPDLVTPGGLAIKLESSYLQLLDDFRVPKSGQAAHLGRNYDCVGAPICGGWKVQTAFALAARFDQLSGHIARDVKGLGNRPALRNQTREILRSCEKQALRQLLDLYLKCQLHPKLIVALPALVNAAGEATKMEKTITAPSAGIIEDLRYAAGDVVEEGAELIAFAGSGDPEVH